MRDNGVGLEVADVGGGGEVVGGEVGGGDDGDAIGDEPLMPLIENLAIDDDDEEDIDPFGMCVCVCVCVWCMCVCDEEEDIDPFGILLSQPQTLNPKP